MHIFIVSVCCSFLGGCGRKRGEIEKPMRNVQRAFTPLPASGYAWCVHRRGRFSEVEHYKCTPGESSRSTEIDLFGRDSRRRSGASSFAKRNPRTYIHACVCIRLSNMGALSVSQNCRTRDGILQALNPSRQAKIDLFSSFAGWRLTNAAEESRRDGEQEGARERESEFG